MIQIKRVYEPPARSDGKRFLVDRFWPRGVKKEALSMEAWLKNAAPSAALLQMVQARSRQMEGISEALSPPVGRARSIVATVARRRGQGDVTLLFSAHDTEHNNAIVLRDHLKRRL